MKLSKPLLLLTDNVNVMHGICQRIARKRAAECAVLPPWEDYRPRLTPWQLVSRVCTGKRN